MWFILELMKETPEGREKVEALYEKIGKYRKKISEGLTSQMLIAEAEDLVRRSAKYGKRQGHDNKPHNTNGDQSGGEPRGSSSS